MGWGYASEMGCGQGGTKPQRNPLIARPLTVQSNLFLTNSAFIQCVSLCT